MKKHFYFTFFIISNIISYSQNGPPWKPAGNISSNGDFLGTLNNVDLLFKTNNTTRITLSSNGDFILNSLT